MTIYILIFIILKLISWIGLSKIFQKAGVEPWKAFVPFLNWSEWLKLIGKPQWWIILLLIPLVNIFYGAYMLIGLSKAFKHYNFWHHAAAVVAFFIYLPYLGYSKKETYYGINGLREGEHLPETGELRKWVDSIIFAVVAAHLIRMFFIEAYKIPTSSMEPTLQIGDYMFVSKMHYGSRIPMTPLSFPLVHHTLPFSKSRAYSEAIKFPYKRLPALQKIKRNDIVVFNVPFEYNMKSPMSLQYYPELRYDSRPVDKREHYIKRIVGMPGDTLEIKNNQLYIDQKKADDPELLQFHYYVQTSGIITKQEWRDMGVRAYVNYFNGSQNPTQVDESWYRLAATPKNIEDIQSNSKVLKVRPADYTNSNNKMPARFPSDGSYKGWTVQDYGPIIIPKKGETIPLVAENIEIYREAIVVHEHNELEIIGGKFFINGHETNEYTFKMDYYFMMGDNRHSSLDSRAWGFVPENHIVGKPLFIFFSKQGGEGNPGTRKERFLKKAQDMN